MNFEQIMIRLGVDGTAIKGGLAKVSATVKAWGTSMVAGFKSYMTDSVSSFMKGFVGAQAIEGAIGYLGKIRDKIIEIRRISSLTGAGTTFAQSLMSIASRTGVPIDRMISGISHFNKVLGAAKMGDTDALKTLKDMGVITGTTSAKTLNFTSAIHNLGVSFDKLNDKQKQAYLLSQTFGKSYAAFQPVFEKGVGAVDEMSHYNPFTRIGPEAIRNYTTIWGTMKKISSGTMATIANAINLFSPIARMAGAFNKIKDLHDGKKSVEEQEKVNAAKYVEAAADEEGISVAEMKVKVLEEQTALMERQAELSSEIADRDKESVAEMATRARKLTGVKGPLEMMHTITPRMRTALRIETLEERAKVAFLRGDDKTSNNLQSEADQVRKANPWLKRSDVNPMSKTESELSRVNAQLEPVMRMAELINKNP